MTKKIKNNFLEEILKYAKVGLIYQQVDGEIKFINNTAQLMFGLGKDEPFNQTSIKQDWHLVYEDGSPCPGDEHPYRITFNTGRHLEGEIRGIVRPDQPVTWISINTRPIIPSGKDTPEAVVITFWDVTENKLAEDQIRKSENRLRLALEAANVGLWDLNLQELSVYLSPTWFTMLGYSQEELPSSFDTWTYLLHPDDRESVIARASETIEGGREDYEQIFRMRTKSGDYRWIRSTGRVMTRDAQGRPINMLGTHVDITDLKEAELHITQANLALDSTLNALPYLLFEVDRQGRYFSYYAQQESLLYRKPEAFLGRTVRDTLPNEAAEIIVGAIEEAAAQGRHSGAIYSLDFPEGRRWFELSIASKGDINDPDCHYIVLARDVTERKQAQEELHLHSLVLGQIHRMWLP